MGRRVFASALVVVTMVTLVAVEVGVGLGWSSVHLPTPVTASSEAAADEANEQAVGDGGFSGSGAKNDRTHIWTGKGTHAYVVSGIHREKAISRGKSVGERGEEGTGAGGAGIECQHPLSRKCCNAIAPK